MKTTPLEPWIASKIGSGGERLTRARIEAYQMRKLRETLALARDKSIFYRRHLAGSPEDISCLEDLARFPFTTAEDIRERGLHFLCVSQSEIHRVVTLQSSGTTGEPKRFYFTRDDQELTLDFFHVGMSTLVEPGDRVLILLPCQRPGSVGDLLATALQRFGVSGIKHGPVEELSETLDVALKENVNCLVGVPRQLLVLARTSLFLDSQMPRIKSVLFATDHGPDAIRKTLERAWDCQVYDHYGMTEMGLGGGVECQAECGYHLREADLYFEIVAPATGQPVADGEKGEVVFTTLTRRGMPLIRYRSGDISRFVPEPCACGTVLRTMERVKNRIRGSVEVGEGQYLTMADLDEALFPIEALWDFSATVVRNEGQDCLRIEADVVSGTEGHVTSTIQDALDSILAVRLARQMGKLDVSVEVRTGGSTRAPGVAKRMVIDMRNQGAV